MKNYFKDINHFINYVNKVSGITFDNHSHKIHFNDQLKVVWAKKLHNKLSWEFKQDVNILNDIPNWVNENYTTKVMNESKTKSFKLVNDTTKEFDDLTEKIAGECGVYIFSTDDNFLYIGRSSTLGKRTLDSYKQRVMINNFKCKVYFSYVITKTFSDAAVLELILIAEKKPLLNKSTKYYDDLSGMISHKYKESVKILAKK